MSLADRRPEEPAPTPARPPAGAEPLTCRDVIEILLDYLEGALGPGVAAALEGHLQDCAPCRAYLRTYRETRRLAGEAVRAEMPAEMPAEMKDRLRALLLDRLAPPRP